MPGFTRQISHPYLRAEALARLGTFIAGVEKKYGAHATEIKQEWKENVLEFNVLAMGIRAQGKLTVEDYFVRIELHYPLIAALFGSRIEAGVVRELEQALA